MATGETLFGRLGDPDAACGKSNICPAAAAPRRQAGTGPAARRDRAWPCSERADASGAREPGIAGAVIAVVVGKSRTRKDALGRDVTADFAPGVPTPPRQVEGRVLRKEAHLRIRQTVVDEPRQRTPVARRPVPIRVDEPGDHHAGRGADAAVRVVMIPDVLRVGLRIAGAIQLVPVAVPVDGGVAKGGSNGDMAEDVAQRLQKIRAEPSARFDREVGFVRDIGDPVNGRDLGVQEIAHEEVFRQPDATKFLHCPDGAAVERRWIEFGAPVGETLQGTEAVALHLSSPLRGVAVRPPDHRARGVVPRACRDTGTTGGRARPGEGGDAGPGNAGRAYRQSGQAIAGIPARDGIKRRVCAVSSPPARQPISACRPTGAPGAASAIASGPGLPSPNPTGSRWLH